MGVLTRIHTQEAISESSKQHSDSSLMQAYPIGKMTAIQLEYNGLVFAPEAKLWIQSHDRSQNDQKLISLAHLQENTVIAVTILLHKTCCLTYNPTSAMLL